MCNEYKANVSNFSIKERLQIDFDFAANLKDSYHVFPDRAAPVVRNNDGKIELVEMRWGLPKPAKYLGPNGANPGVTNIRHPNYPHWRQWMGIGNRCVVPATSFCEWTATPPKERKWFALDDSQPMFFFAGAWTPWRGVRAVKEGVVDVDIFSFFTTDANNAVKPIHDKAMPVILRTAEEVKTWLTEEASIALKLQKPLPDDALVVLQ